MSKYTEISFRIFGQISGNLIDYFPELKNDLKKSRIRLSVQEYLSTSFFTTLIIFLISLPILSLLISLAFPIFLFSFLLALIISIAISAATFLIFLYYPKFVSRSLSKKIENNLPFATLYLSTISSAKLPLHKVFEIFERFGEYEAVVKEIKTINSDVKLLGLDINTAIEREIERCPSKNMQELLWGILSTSQVGGDVTAFLKEKSRGFFAEYRRKLYEFAHSLSLYIEIYLIAVVLGAIFFTIITSIVAGIAGIGGNLVLIQFLLVFIFLPLIAMLFTFMVKSAAPGE